MKAVFGAIVVGIIAIAVYVLATAGATFTQLALIVGGLQ